MRDSPADSASSWRVQPQLQGFGARITGIDLSTPFSSADVAALRKLWLTHQVLYFPKQPLSHAELLQFAEQFGPFGEDPYVQPLSDQPHILEVRREPHETVSPFGASWHSDWSFQAMPPSATMLHAKVIPPFGGETLFADGYRAYEALPADLREEIRHLRVLHSARRPYSHEGYARSGGNLRSMHILPADDAWVTQSHPLVRTHPETGRRALWINHVYVIAVEHMNHAESESLLKRLNDHALQPAFIYTHHWAPNMLTMWDNRCVQHCAQGGYDGHRRVLHRCVIAGDRPV